MLQVKYQQILKNIYSIKKNIFLKPDSANKKITGMLKHGNLFETNKTIPGVIAFTVINPRHDIC